MKPEIVSEPGKLKKILKSNIGALIIINLLLAVVAFFKDILLASYLGTSAQADALLLAFFVPDTIGNNLIAFALGVSCIPVFSILFVKGMNERLNNCIRNVSAYILFFSALLLVLLYIFKNEIITMLGSGFDPKTSKLCLSLYNIVLPTILLFPVVAIGTSILQVLNRFKISAFAPVLYNIVFLGGVVLGYLLNVPIEKGVYLVAISIICGVFSMTILILVSLKRIQDVSLKTLLFFKNFPKKNELKDVRDIFKTMLPYILILLASQSVYFFERYLASNLETGSIAGLNYAFRLAQFPGWVFVAAISVVILPSMSKAKGIGQLKAMKATFVRSLKTVLLITFPLAIILFTMRIPILSVLFKRGAFDSNSLEITAGILAGYSLTIIGQSILAISLRFFFVIGQMLSPLIVVIISSTINIIADFFFVKQFGSAGIGYGAALGAFLNVPLILFFLRRPLHLKISKHLPEFLKIMITNLPVLLISLGCNRVWHFFKSGIFVQAGFIFLSVLTCCMFYWIGLKKYKLV